MAKTLTRNHRAKHQVKHRIAQDVDRIIKKAMLKTKAAGLKRKVRSFLNGTRDKTEMLHKDVANYAYKKPYTSLGLAMVTGAAIALLVNKSIHNAPRRRFRW